MAALLYFPAGNPDRRAKARRYSLLDTGATMEIR